MDVNLSPAMSDLLAAIYGGVTVFYSEGMRYTTPDRWVRGDTMQGCSQQVRGLLKRGLIRKVSVGRSVRVVPA
jgi:hypothetical protein